MERSFALDRAGHMNKKGRGNPLRLATAKPHEAEFFVAGAPRGGYDGGNRGAFK